MAPTQLPIFTVGHSTRPLPEFLALLAASHIACLVDVRRLPGSRAFPQFDADALQTALAQAGVDYWRLPALCGRRRVSEVRDMPADHFWKNASFARYASWSRGSEFRAALDAFLARADAERCILMCAEAVWWRCHRRIITDHLLARGREVCHIMGPGKVVPASLTRGAAVHDGRLEYPDAGVERSKA